MNVQTKFHVHILTLDGAILPFLRKDVATFDAITRNFHKCKFFFFSGMRNVIYPFKRQLPPSEGKSGLEHTVHQQNPKLTALLFLICNLGYHQTDDV